MFQCLSCANGLLAVASQLACRHENSIYLFIHLLARKQICMFLKLSRYSLMQHVQLQPLACGSIVMWISTPLWFEPPHASCENTMYCYGLAYHVCNRIVHTAFHILSMYSKPFVLFTVSLVSWRCTTHTTLVVLHCTPKPQIQACQALTAQPNPNGVNSTPPQSGPDNCCLLQSRSAHTKRPTIGLSLELSWMC